MICYAGVHKIGVVMRAGGYWWRRIGKGSCQHFSGPFKSVADCVADAKVTLNLWIKPLPLGDGSHE